MLRTLEKITWKKIKVGEVFAMEFCWVICCKLNKDQFLMLASDYSHFNCDDGDMDFGISTTYTMQGYPNYWHDTSEIYKLPLSVQRLWRQD